MREEESAKSASIAFQYRQQIFSQLLKECTTSMRYQRHPLRTQENTARRPTMNFSIVICKP